MIFDVKCRALEMQEYFDRCLDLLHEDPAEVKRLAVRYSTLFNIYTGFYRNKAFEQRVTDIIGESMLETRIPREFADYLSVFLSFNNVISQVRTSDYLSVFLSFNNVI